MIDLYCERVAPGLWDEPANALTNLAFFAAAWAGWRLLRAQRPAPATLWLLLALIGVIGAGSLLFHTFATRWAMWLDLLPIVLFQLLFVWTYGGSVMRLGAPARLLLVAALLVAVYAGLHLPHLLNGSLIYLPALLLLLAIGVYHRRHARYEPGLLLWGTGLLTLALAFRSADQSLCEYVRFGTHFGWHLLVGAVLYLCFRALLLNRHAGQATVHA